MADPYGTGHHSLEPEDMSSFLQNLLHGASTSADGDDGGGLFPRPATEATDFMGRMRDGASAPAIEPSPSLNFSDPSLFYGAQVKGSAVNAFSSAAIGDFDATGSSKRIEFEDDNKVKLFRQYFHQLIGNNYDEFDQYILFILLRLFVRNCYSMMLLVSSYT